jgi:hypothetical protein
MTFREVFPVVVIASVLVGAVWAHLWTEKAKREGRSIRYIPTKVVIFVGVVFYLVLAPFTNMPIWLWLIIACVGLAAGVLQVYNLRLQRRTFRKIFRLPPEDEDTGEVIKEKEKKKDE